MNESTQLAIVGESLNKSLRLVDSQQIKMLSSIPGWVRFCSNTAPLAAIVVFMAVCKTKRKEIEKNDMLWIANAMVATNRFV